MVPDLPTLYDYYTSGGISTGLSANQNYFTLNNRNISIYSGAAHYFRIPQEYWRDRLRRMRAAGLNTVETYVPWNLHEYQENRFDFGNGESDMREFLDLQRFLQTAQEEDLLAIVRPGPFICAEWEFGGFPSWLLRYKGIKVRTSQQTYMKFVERYFNVLLKLLALLQFTQGGPIIAFQVENEYGSTETKTFAPDKAYLHELRNIYLRNGIVELLFTSDSPTGHRDKGTLPQYFLQTANFAGGPEKEFAALAKLQRNKPFMAMEFWTGWFDHWSEKHHTRNNSDFADVLERILKYPASVNMYMFQGGTNWGFLNGANIADSSVDNGGFQPDTTSYDYDAPISENGDYTEKYVITKRLLRKYSNRNFRVPETPGVHLRTAFTTTAVTQQLNFNEMVDKSPYHFNRANLLPMEYLPINNNSGQSYGYILYRKSNIDIEPNSVLKIAGRVCDTVIVLLNGILISPPLRNALDLNRFGYWRLKNSTLSLGPSKVMNATLDLLVENWGRNNFGTLNQFVQHKGLWQGDVYVNSKPVYGWEIVPMEFKTSWTNSLTGWHDVQMKWMPQPALYKVTFNVNIKMDTYLDMRNWTKGIVIINGFVLGRYAIIGPQQTLYLPAPLLREGPNDLIIFEHYYASDSVKFTRDPIYMPISKLYL